MFRFADPELFIFTHPIAVFGGAVFVFPIITAAKIFANMVIRHC